MEITESITVEDKIEIVIFIYNKLGIIKKEIIKLYIFTTLICAVFIIFLFLIHNPVTDAQKAGILFFFCVFVTTCFFPKRKVEKYQKKHLKNYYSNILRKMNMTEVVTKTIINKEFVEIYSLNSMTRFLNVDFIEYFEYKDYYILEYKNMRFISFKVSNFNTKDDFNTVLKIITDGKILDNSEHNLTTAST